MMLWKKNEARPVVLPAGSKLVLSSSPHLSRPESVTKIMLLVVCALLPAAASGIYYFGWRALGIILFTIACCVLAEVLWRKMVGKPVARAVKDCSAVVTGLLLALNLPPGVPFYVPVIGSILAIWLGKHVFGGVGRNPFNPALVARVGLLIALPSIMTAFYAPRGMDNTYPQKELFSITTTATGEVTCATPLSVVGTKPKVLGKSEKAVHNFAAFEDDALLKKWFWGVRGGCIGETCVPALLLGWIILMAFNLINWRVPLCFVGMVFAITGVVHYFYPGVTPSPLFHIVNGGLLLGAIFMATDMVTCPITGNGCVVFALGCGILTAVIRIWGNYPEGVSFSILFMNALVPLIDRWCGIRPFGFVRKR